MIVILLALWVASWAGPVFAVDTGPRLPPTLVQDYQGVYQADFASNFDRVRLLTEQSQLEVSVRLGLFDYRSGFHYPVQISFQDNASGINTENTLAFVQLTGGTTSFMQQLVVNLAELHAHPQDFDMVFYHEMTHVVINDSVGGNAALKLPRWLHEGLAIYVSGDGDRLVKEAVGKRRRSEVSALVQPITSAPSGSVYPIYYLAIKYLLDIHSINSVQALVRNLVNGMRTEDALRDATGLTIEEFKQHVQDYSLKTYQGLASPDPIVNPFVQPKGIKSKLTGLSKD